MSPKKQTKAKPPKNQTTTKATKPVKPKFEDHELNPQILPLITRNMRG